MCRVQACSSVDLGREACLAAPIAQFPDYGIRVSVAVRSPMPSHPPGYSRECLLEEAFAAISSPLLPVSFLLCCTTNKEMIRSSRKERRGGVSHGGRSLAGETFLFLREAGAH